MTAPTLLIHVVDDDASLWTAVMRVLRAAVYEVRGYASAGEFLLARLENQPGCVVLDVPCPAQMGWTFRQHSESVRTPCPSSS